VPVKHAAKIFPPPSGSSLKQEGTPIEFELGDALLLFPTRPSGFEEVSGDIVGMDERPRKCPPLGYMSECYRFLPDDKELPKGTTLTISYEPPRVGLCPEGQIAVYWYDTSRGEWTRLQSAVDTEAKTVRAEVTRLGLFALSGEIFGEDVTPPSLAIVSPASGALVSGPVTVSVQAGDDNGVASVNFVLDDEPIGYDLIGADGWTIEIDPSEYAAGKHTLLVIAEDASGNTSETSIELIFGTPESGEPTPPPSVPPRPSWAAAPPAERWYRSAERLSYHIDGSDPMTAEEIAGNHHAVRETHDGYIDLPWAGLGWHQYKVHATNPCRKR
jgi:hypothetical protein